MPRRTDLKRILVIGSGPIVIGQACEFDYSGTQAIKALRAEGLEVILVNSNPATIMTDPELADRTYVEPLTVDVVERIIAKEKPDAILPTVGGQTALNLAVALHEAGVLDKYGVKLIGASIAAIHVAEDRQQFHDAMVEIGLDVPKSRVVKTLAAALEAVEEIGFPAIIRPSFTLGGVGGGIAYNIEEFKDICGRGLDLSPVHEVLVEESVIGWKEYELEVMRDVADNFVVICSIENIDPMGVHTGDSITVAPALTLTDKEYQRMRDAGRRIIRRVGVETGGSNIQFAINPADGRMTIIEMNPRVSRSSALASKATGFPIAKIAAKLALGYHLDEIPNDITKLTPASFEPTIDYVVVKIPRWNFEKFPQADRTLTTQMKSVGEAMAIGRTFKEAFLKGIRSLELGSREGRLFGQAPLAGARPDAATTEELEAGLRRRLVGADRPADVGGVRGARARVVLSSASTSSPKSTRGSCSSSPTWSSCGAPPRWSACATCRPTCCARSSAPASATASSRTSCRWTSRRCGRSVPSVACSPCSSASTPARRSSSRSRRTCTARSSRTARPRRRRPARW